MQNDDISSLFFHFFKTLIFWAVKGWGGVGWGGVGGGSKREKIAQNEK